MLHNKMGLKFILLLIVAFVPRVINLGGHNIFVDEIIWMSRCKDVYGTVRTLSWNPNYTEWWLVSDSAEAIGLPVTFLCGLSMTFLSPGYSHYSLNIAQDFVAARVPVAIIGTLFVPFFYFLLRKFIDDKIAFIASLLLALDPVSIGLSRWLHHDMALVAFSTLSLMLYLRGKRIPLIIASSFLAALAILTKPQGFLVVGTILIFSITSLFLRQKVDIKKLLVWLVAGTLFTIALFPYLWIDPVGRMLDYLFLQRSIVNLGNLTYFNGAITQNPPWYYYFAIFPFRVPESVLLGFFMGLVITIIGIKRNLLKNDFSLMAIIYSVLFLAVISFSDKKLGIRYLLGVWPYIFVIAASGLVYIEKLVGSSFRKAYWLIVFLFPVWGILKFYPSFYLYYNHLITPAGYQNLESVGYCDSVKPAITYLEPKLYHGIKLMLPGCDAAINYYTGFTVNRVYSVADKPDFIIEETHNAQKSLTITDEILKAGYKEIKIIDFRGLILARIYQKPVD